ncbi:DNRLRE domain-containing protein [Neobacillus vireti]|uniref:DNRLRE domain-containing protein n=1 Tax=Neobacillus vireti TaxID=220686 RepID=UPI002FFEF462
MKKYSKQFLSLLLCTLMVCTPMYTFFMGYKKVAAAATEPVVFPVTQDAFVSNFSGQGNSLGITLNSNKLIYGKSRHTYLKFDLSSIDTERYKIDEMQMKLSFRKTHAPNKLIFTESEATLRDSSEEWSINNLTYNNRPNDEAGSPVVTQNVTSNGEETLSIDLSSIFQFALKNGRKVVSIYLTTADVNDGTIAASEMYSSRNTTAQPAPSLAVTLGEPVVNAGVDSNALDALMAELKRINS